MQHARRADSARAAGLYKRPKSSLPREVDGWRGCRRRDASVGGRGRASEIRKRSTPLRHNLDVGLSCPLRLVNARLHPPATAPPQGTPQSDTRADRSAAIVFVQHSRLAHPAISRTCNVNARRHEELGAAKKTKFVVREGNAHSCHSCAPTPHNENSSGSCALCFGLLCGSGLVVGNIAAKGGCETDGVS